AARGRLNGIAYGRCLILALLIRTLIVEADPQFAEWNHDVCPESTPFLEPLVPCLHVPNSWTVDFEFEIAIERGARGDVRQREGIAAQEPPVRQYLVQQLKMLGAARDLFFDSRPVPLRLRCPIKSPEDPHQKVSLKRGLHPVHP